MGLGSFFKGIGGAIGGALGITGSRNNAAGERNVAAYGDDLKGGEDAYRQQLGGLNSASNQLANNNYMAGAQNSFGQQQAAFGTQQNAYGNQQDAYRAQQGASQMLYNQATGNTPSVADIQMQAGLGNANNQVQSAAYSQQGGISPGLTQRNMLGAQAAQNAAIVGQGMATRANEINTAQTNYNAAMQGLSGTAANMSNSANALGQTAAGMTNQQMNMGEFGYQQGQNNLNYQTANANNLQQVNATNAQNLLAGQQGNIAAATAANAAQSAAMGQTLKSVGGMMI